MEGREVNYENLNGIESAEVSVCIHVFNKSKEILH